MHNSHAHKHILFRVDHRAEVAINEALGTENVGERVWRVFFGVVSLP
jgi:hypothetical protein